MLFTNPAFLFCFAPIVLTLYRILPVRWRNGFLLTASIALYAWGEGRYLGVLLASIAINYGCGLAIGNQGEPRRRKFALAAGVAANLLLLGFFKYAGFAASNLNWLLQRWQAPLIPSPSPHLPIGISFFTFMGMSYLIDLYRRQITPERSPATFGLYITLFPHLIAGPIVRFSDIAGQLSHRPLSLDQTVEGIRRFVIGLGKKMLIGNTLAVTADAVFQMPVADLSTPLAWLGALCYTFQIYYDFSGYSDMAIGLAGILGFTFPENFNYPYIAQSITEFWKRWHITLSTWFRDYVFFSLGVRGGRAILYRNLLIVFVLCGLWHGASWHFVAWGLFYGLFLVLERMGLTGFLQRRAPVVRHVYTLLTVISGWVIFRAETLSKAMAFLAAMFGFSNHELASFDRFTYLPNDVVMALILGAIGSMPALPYLKTLLPRPQAGLALGALEFAGLASVFVAAAALAAAGTYNPFIYFRF